jgi:branched-chain amino acid transport system permease protein
MRQLDRVGLAGMAGEPAGNLALGSQRLVEIARALASDPALLLLDEPAAGLRHQEKQALSAVLRQLKDQGLSLLLVEHDMDFVMSLADRIVVMEFGSMLMQGTPEQVQASAAVRAAYLGVEH